MAELDMDCSEGVDGWFEVKAFLTNAGINSFVIELGWVILFMAF